MKWYHEIRKCEPVTHVTGSDILSTCLTSPFVLVIVLYLSRSRSLFRPLFLLGHLPLLQTAVALQQGGEGDQIVSYCALMRGEHFTKIIHFILEASTLITPD